VENGKRLARPQLQTQLASASNRQAIMDYNNYTPPLKETRNGLLLMLLCGFLVAISSVEQLPQGASLALSDHHMTTDQQTPQQERSEN